MTEVRGVTTSTLGDRRSGRFAPSAIMLTLIVALDVLLVVVGFGLQHYFGRDILTSLTFVSGDGGYTTDPSYVCVPAHQGLGDHCFGDYTFSKIFASQADPWLRFLNFNFNYTAGALLPFLAAGWLGHVTGDPRVGLWLFELALAVGMTIPAVWAGRGRSIAMRIAIGAGLGIVSIPGLMVLDRGNSAGFLVPVIWLLLLGIARDKRILVIAMIVVASLIKPQFALLVLFPLFRRQWRDALIAAAVGAVANGLAFLAWPSGFPGTILASIRNTLQYGSTASLRTEFPANVSFARGFDYLVVLFSRGSLSATTPTLVERWQGIIGPAIVILLVIALVVLGKRVDPVVAAMLLTISIAVMTAISYSYYLAVVLAFAAVIMRDPSPEPLRRGLGRLDELQRPPLATVVASVAIAVAAALTVSRIILPGFPDGNSSLVRTSAEWVPLAWLIAIVLVVVAASRDGRVGAASQAVEGVAPAQEAALDGDASVSTVTAEATA